MFTDANLNSGNIWHFLPYEKKFIQRKKGLSYISFTFLFIYYKKHKCFFENPLSIPNDFIEEFLSFYSCQHLRNDIFLCFEDKRTLTRYQNEIRSHFNVKPFTEETKKTLIQYLTRICFTSKNDEVIKQEALSYCTQNQIEFPHDVIIKECLRVAKKNKETELFENINYVLSDHHKKHIDEVVLSPKDQNSHLQFLREDSGATNRLGIDQEIERLNLIKQLPFNALHFLNKINPRIRYFYRRRLFTDTPERTKRRLPFSRHGLVMLFCHHRHQECLDNLTQHLLNLILKIKKKVIQKEKKLQHECVNNIEHLNTLYEMAEIARDHPKEIIEKAIYSSIPIENIHHIIQHKDIKTHIKKDARFSFSKSYSSFYRPLIFKILEHINICSNDPLYIKALHFIKEQAAESCEFYHEEMPVDLANLVSLQAQKYIKQQNEQNISRIYKKIFEIEFLKNLRDKLRHKEIWIEGSFKYRNPSEDFPSDFNEKREAYYKELDLPLAASDFTQLLKERMSNSIKTFDDNLPQNPYVQIIIKKGKPWIKLSPFEKQPDPPTLIRLHEAIFEKWNFTNLLEVLNEVDFRERLTSSFSTVGNRHILDHETIRKRMILCLFGIGTNTGLKHISSACRGVVSFEELRHIYRFFMNKDDLREAIARAVNAIFRIRDPLIWGESTTACASDSTQFGSYDQNLMSQWHPRYHANGVMIYWHVTNQHICIYSQLKTCTSSEVASMLQGLLSHEAKIDIQSQYVDSHGKSLLGFAISHFLKFDLLPRYKQIGNQKLYKPSDDFNVTNINNIMTRSIDWELIESQYDEMVKYIVALKKGIATADTLIRKFASSNYKHPTFQAFIELGNAVKTIFLCRYLNSVELRQEINAGLNVVENWNGANNFVYYGKNGEMKSNSHEDQEISMLCLHLLQLCITYINTLFIQDILKSPDWKNKLTKEDLRALSPLFYQHINPYGTFEVDFNKRIHI